MYKNTTLLALQFQIDFQKCRQTISRHLSPLFQLQIIDIKNEFRLKRISKLFRSTILQNSKQTKNFNKILVLHVNSNQNARRKVLINIKRSSLIQFFNKQSKQGYMYNMTLNKINQFVSQQQLINQLRMVFKKQYQISKVSDQSKVQSKVSKVTPKQDLAILEVINNFSIESWQYLLKYRFQMAKISYIRMHQLQQSYLSLELTNAYKIKSSALAQQLYQDLKDFDLMLAKFNFIRFFNLSNLDNFTRAQKNCEAFVKNIKWRTKQSQKYLMHLLRNNSWERFCLFVQNFVYLYQTQVIKVPKPILTVQRTNKLFKRSY